MDKQCEKPHSQREEVADSKAPFRQQVETLEEAVSALRTDVRDIKHALIGNDELKQPGIVQRLEAVEVSDQEQKKVLSLWGGLITVVAASFTQVLEWIKK